MNIGYFTGHISSWLRPRRIGMGICSFFAMCGIWSGVKAALLVSNPEQIAEFAPSMGFLLTMFFILALRCLQVGLVMFCAKSKLTCPLAFVVVFVACTFEGVYLGATMLHCDNLLISAGIAVLCLFPSYLFFSVSLYCVYTVQVSGNIYGELSSVKYLALTCFLLTIINSAFISR